MKNSKPISWNDLWMKMAILIAKRSKDPNTQVGCVLVSPDNRQMRIGYNGFAVGINEPSERWERPTKYDFVIHAETNAILNSKCDLQGWTCYVTLKPCEKCSSLIVQSGIKEIVYLNDNTKSANYTLTDVILKEGKVKVRKYEGNMEI